VKYVGKDRYETATKLANAYFDDYDYIGLASGEVAADAVVAGAVMANVDATLVLTQASKLPKATDQFLSYDVDGASLVVFGGKAAISNDVVDAAERAVNKR
jgi:putative cell wall-binding protein